MIPEFNNDATIRELFSPAMDIAERRDHHEAKLWVECYLDFLRTKGLDAQEALDMLMTNLGYYAGYHGPETRKAVAEVFGAVHPVFGYQDRFGRIAPEPTAEEAFAAGTRLGEKAKGGRA